MSIELENLHIGYKHKIKTIKIASPITASFKTASMNVIVGLNGAGKTTLIKTLGHLLPSLKGSIQIQGQQLQNLKSIELAKLISLVLTSSLASENMSVYELVSLGRHPHSNWFGRLKQKDFLAIEASLRFTSLEELSQKKFHTLSDGQKQKVLIARALAQDTPYIILDEPMAHLDLHHKAQLLSLLQKLVNEKEKTIILSTHDIEMALSYADYMLVLGKEQNFTGSPKSLTEEGVFNALFPSEFIEFKADTQRFLYKGFNSK